MYFLDSDICIDLMRGELPVVLELMQKTGPDMFGISAVVEAELRTGAKKSKKPQENLFKLNQFLAPFVSIPFDSECSVAYAAIRSRLEKDGKRIGQNDTLIAATAIAHGATLVTGNVREFSRVPNLEVENWREITL